MILFALVSVALGACQDTPDITEQTTVDALIEAGLITHADMRDHEGFTSHDHMFYETDFITVYNLLRSTNESLIIYVGFAACPWCVYAINPMYEAAREQGVERILYINRRSETNHFPCEEDEWRPSDMENILMAFLEPHMGFVTRGELTRIFVPEVIVWDGTTVIASNQGTLAGHDAVEESLTEEESDKLRQIYLYMFALLK